MMQRKLLRTIATSVALFQRIFKEKKQKRSNIKGIAINLEQRIIRYLKGMMMKINFFGIM